jgi:hypothetical protein
MPAGCLGAAAALSTRQLASAAAPRCTRRDVGDATPTSRTRGAPLPSERSRALQTGGPARHACRLLCRGSVTRPAGHAAARRLSSADLSGIRLSVPASPSLLEARLVRPCAASFAPCTPAPDRRSRVSAERVCCGASVPASARPRGVPFVCDLAAARSGVDVRQRRSSISRSALLGLRGRRAAPIRPAALPDLALRHHPHTFQPTPSLSAMHAARSLLLLGTLAATAAAQQDSMSRVININNRELLHRVLGSEGGGRGVRQPRARVRWPSVAGPSCVPRR